MFGGLFNIVAGEPQGAVSGGGGLLDAFSDPRRMAMLGLASGLLQASGRSTQPVSMGQAFGMGLQNAAQFGGLAQRQQLQNAQMAKIKADAAEAERKRKSWEAALNGGGGSTMIGGDGSGGTMPSPMMGMTPDQLSALRAMGPDAGGKLLAERAFKEPKTFGDSTIGYYRMDGGKAVPLVPGAGKNPQQGTVRKYTVGDNEVSEEWTGAEWRKLGSGPRLQDDRSLVKVLGKDGTVTYAPRNQAVGATAPDEATIIMGPDGKPIYLRGGPQSLQAMATGLEKKTAGEIEERMLNTADAMARVANIERSFKPEYLQLGTRAGMALSSMKDFAGIKLSPDQEKGLSEFTTFRRDSVSNLNRTIKDITGAAMSIPEAERITKEVPNAGTGVFDGDSPTAFKAKLAGVSRDLRHAMLRYNYARARGLDPLKSGIDLKDVPALVEKRGAEIEREVRAQNPGITDEAARAQVRALLSGEFGMR